MTSQTSIETAEYRAGFGTEVKLGLSYTVLKGNSRISKNKCNSSGTVIQTPNLADFPGVSPYGTLG